MPVWVVEAKGEAREVYVIKAPTEEDARRIFSSGECKPVVVENSGMEIDEIRKVHGERSSVG